MKRIGTLIVTLLILAAPVLAQQPAPTNPPAAAKDEFVPVEAPVTGQDAMPAPRLVAIAYAFIWVVFFGYLLSLRMRLSKVEKEIAAVSRRAAGGGRPA
jgi:CcmD family protein